MTELANREGRLQNERHQVSVGYEHEHVSVIKCLREDEVHTSMAVWIHEFWDVHIYVHGSHVASHSPRKQYGLDKVFHIMPHFNITPQNVEF